MAMIGSRTSLAVSCVLGLAACSGSSGTLLGPNGADGGGDGNASSSGSDSAASSSSSGSGASSSGGSSGGGPSSSGTADGGTQPEAAAGDASAGADGGVDGGGVMTDSGPAADGNAGDASGGPGMACGNLRCSVPAQTCCASLSATGTVTSCANGATCPGPASTTLECESTADCTGQNVCCVSQQNNGSIAECRAVCGGGDTQLCDPASPDPGCSQGQPCQPPNGGAPPTPTGVGTCGG